MIWPVKWSNGMSLIDSEPIIYKKMEALINKKLPDGHHRALVDGDIISVHNISLPLGGNYTMINGEVICNDDIEVNK